LNLTNHKFENKKKVQSNSDFKLIDHIERTIPKFKELDAIFEKIFFNLSQLRTDSNSLKRKQFSKKTRKAVLERQNYRCRICEGVLDVYDLDHIDGNKWNNNISNCQALCPTCHRRKSKKNRGIPKFSKIDFSEFLIK